MKIALAIVAIFFARFAVSAWFYPGQDADLGWQQWLGDLVLQTHQIPQQTGVETFTAPHLPWVAQEWAFSTLVSWTLEHGRFALLAMLVAGAAAGALALTAWRSKKRGASTFAIALTTAFTGFAMMQSFGVRAQIAGWFLLALIMLLLDTEGPWLFFAIPIVAIWANLHASALVAPVFVAAWALGTAIEDRAWTPRVERNVVLAAGCVLAVFVTPFFWHLPAYAVTLETSGFRSAISEWQAGDIVYPALFVGVLPLIAIACYFGVAAPRERWRDGLLFGLAAFLAFTAVRHLPICALVIAPMAAQRLSSAIGSRARVNALLSERFSQGLVYVAAAVTSVIVAVTLAKTPAIAGDKLPGKAVARLANSPGAHRLYCEDFAWCSLALRDRNVRVFLDGRCDPYPQAVWDDYLAVERGTPRWSAVLDLYRVNAVLAQKGRPLSEMLKRQQTWRQLYHDGSYVLFVRAEKTHRLAVAR